MNAIAPRGFLLRPRRRRGHARTLDRAERLNALTFAIYRELREVLDALDEHAEARAVVITGEGKAFCSGGDVEDIIGQLFARDMQGLLEFTRVTGALIGSLRRLRKPIVAAVNGVAVGAGAVIALACRLARRRRERALRFHLPKGRTLRRGHGRGILAAADRRLGTRQRASLHR